MKMGSFAAQILLSSAFTAGIVACTDAAEEPANEAQAADVEVLPADESAATSSEDLANGSLDAPADDNGSAPANAQ